MKALLDTNIIIHRENKIISNYNIGHLFNWLNKLHYDLYIHPLTKEEINKYKDKKTNEVMHIKLDSYQELIGAGVADFDFLNKLEVNPININDSIDASLLYALYQNKVDILITEDKKLRQNSKKVGLDDKVFSIDSFIDKVSQEYPDLIDYKTLSVKKVHFGEIDLKDEFFDSLRKDYNQFDEWFCKKNNEEAYICKDDNNKILGFLYLKTEHENDDWTNIIPSFDIRKRLKIGTFKVESTGFRLGERFIKIIFDNAIERNVDEIYVTLFDKKEELVALKSLFKNWGFKEYGTKHNLYGDEIVLVKELNSYDDKFSPKINFPNVKYNVDKYILPIDSKYHTDLLPDSILKNENEIDFLKYKSYRYALQKVYISWAFNIKGAKPGDLVLFYCCAPKDGKPAHYSSCITALGVIDYINSNIQSKDELLKECENRSIFSKEELNNFWENKKNKNIVIKFIYFKNLVKNVTLSKLRELNIISFKEGPRPFTKLSDQEFDQIIFESNTKIKYEDK